MDKILTKYHMGEALTELEQIKMYDFMTRHTQWQRTVIREFYWLGPRFVEERYGVDVYNMLTNIGILEVE